MCVVYAKVKGMKHRVQLLFLLIVVFTRIHKKDFRAGSLLVIAPHPDDEVLGVGGVMISALERKQNVHILYLTEGEATRADPDPETIRKKRKHLSEAVRKYLDIPSHHIHHFYLTDGKVSRAGSEHFDAIVSRLRELIDGLKPDQVFATHEFDFWPFDHVACAELARAAVARSTYKPQLIYYWVWAWYNLRPWRLRLKQHPGLRRVDISRWSTAKRKLVSLYLDPKSPSGVPWSGHLPKVLHQSVHFKFEVIEVMEEK